jgi:alpha-galactosidase
VKATVFLACRYGGDNVNIQYDTSTKQFHLYNGAFSYIIKILDSGDIGQVYFGAPLDAGVSHLWLAPVPFAGFSNNDKAPARFEYPTYGTGDFRLPAFQVRLVDGAAAGSMVVTPVFQSYRIMHGKPDIPGLPSTYTERETETETLELELLDVPSGLRIILYYTIFATENCIARHVRFVNSGNGTIVLENAMSLSLDLPDSNWNLLTLTGAWAREFQVTDEPLRPGFQGVSSSRGISSAQASPSLLFRRVHTDNFAGEAFGVSLLYSGNFAATAEVDYLDITRIRIGINSDTFSWTLEPNASFDTPEAVLAWSGAGLNGLSAQFHALYRSRLVRGVWRDKERPVLLNNWEGTYFNFTEAEILEMASLAVEMGVELFVLDDGWFGKRDSDNSSLGDWFPDTRKLPDGVAGLARKVTEKELKFGLWFEPEMISEKSELFKAHPDWAIGIQGRPGIEFRWQRVLDFSRKEIVDNIYEQIATTLKSAPISYIKWDMNRALTEPFSLALTPERQGEFFHRYVLGVYDLYRRLTTTFPDVLFESCCSGGGRFDAGILAFAPQGWLSDDTDAVERLSIQEGASLVYPQSSVGAHVSAVPNHQTSRVTPLAFRAMTSFFGVLGFELDPTKLAGDEKAAIATYIAFYKAHRRTFQYGNFTRLESPVGNRHAAWMVTTADGVEAIVGVYKILSNPNQKPWYLHLAALDHNVLYDVGVWEEGGYDAADKALNCGTRGGDELMSAGLLLECAAPNTPKRGDFAAELFLLHRKD